MIFDRTLQRGQIIPRHDNRVVERSAIQAGTVGNLDGIGAQSECGGRQDVRTHEEVVVPTVVVSLEFQKLRPSGHAPRQTNSRHHGFGTGIRKTHALGVRNNTLQHLSHFQFNGRSCGKVRSAGSRFGDGFHDLRMRMAQRQRAEGHHPIDVLVAVNVVDTRAAAALHKNGILAEIRRPPRGRTAGLNQHPEGPLVNLFRLFGAEGQMDLRSR